MKLALEARIDNADNDDDNANDTNDDDTNNNNNAYDNNNEFGAGGVVIVVSVVAGIVTIGGVLVNVLCFVSTGLYWSYLEGGPCMTESKSGKCLVYTTV